MFAAHIPFRVCDFISCILRHCHRKRACPVTGQKLRRVPDRQQFAAWIVSRKNLVNIASIPQHIVRARQPARRLHTGGGVLRALCGVCGCRGISILPHLRARLLRGLCVCLTASTLPDDVNACADAAHGRAHRRVIQRLAQIEPGRGVISGPLQDGLENVLKKFLTALGDHGEGHTARRAVVQLGKRAADGVIQNAAAERLLEGACHVADLLRGKAQSAAPKSVGKLLVVVGPGLSGPLGAAPGGTGRHQSETGSGDHGAGRNIPRHLYALHAQIHGELTHRPQPFLGLCHVRSRALRQAVRLLIRLVRHRLVGPLHRLGVAIMGRDAAFCRRKVALHLLHVRRRHGLAVGPLHVPEHLFIPLYRVMVALKGIPGVLVGDPGVQLPGPLCQHTAQIRKGGTGGLRCAGHNVFDAAGRIVFDAGGVCHKALLLPCVRGGFLRCSGLGNRRFPFPISH